MKQRVRDIIQQGDRLFSARGVLTSHWQDVAENFYPQRADFTTTRTAGDELASNLMSGYPVLAHRDLANSLSSILRPRGEPWFHARTASEKINKNPTALAWLDWASDILRRIMYEPSAQFIRATKQGDHDFSAFGQCVIQIEMTPNRDGLLYRSWHLRDNAWCENAQNVIDTNHRDWKPEANQLQKLFPKTVHSQVRTAAEKEPYKKVKCRHVVLPADQYDYQQPDAPRRKLPFVSIYIDCENDTILEETAVPSFDYVIPRWALWPGSQYGMSPAVMAALPDARMLQQIGLTLLEAGQKAVDPPMIASGEVVQGGVNSYAGGITWIDSEYDERTGEALRPLNIDTRGLNWGVAREEKCQAMIAEAFYLNKLKLPDQPGKTAYETRQLVEQYIRDALPLFEPMESEYNGGLCEKSFEIAQRMFAFGSPYDMPPILRGLGVRFQFESPLQAATERAKASAFIEFTNLTKAAMELDPTISRDADVDVAYRDAALGLVPPDWIRDEDQAAALKAQDRDQIAQQQQQQQQIAGASQVADVADKAGGAVQKLQGAGILPNAA